MDVVHREVTQSFMLDFTGQSAAPCLQVERLTGSLADALFVMANDHHCLPSPLEAFVKYPKNSDPLFFLSPTFLKNEQSSPGAVLFAQRYALHPCNALHFQLCISLLL